MNSQISALIQSRRSCRKYLDKAVSPEIIDECLEAARLAPSACNLQPWYFLVVLNNDIKQKLSAVAFSGIYSMNAFAVNASALIIVLREIPKHISRVAGFFRGTNYGLIDLGIACEHLVLKAQEKGLSSCYIGWFNQRSTRKFLGIPKDKKVDLIISLGYSDYCYVDKKTRDINQIREFR